MTPCSSLPLEDISPSPVTSVGSTLLHRLYKHEFQAFIKHKLVEQARIRLARSHLSDTGREGLGDAFVCRGFAPS